MATIPIWRTTRRLLGKHGLLLYVLLSACSTLPNTERLTEVAPTQAHEVEGPQGALSAKQSTAVVQKLERKVDTDLIQRHLDVMEKITDSPLTIGNQATLLYDGPATYKAMFAAMHQARDHINLETYIFEDDEVGQRVADLLIAKQRAGVQVQIVYDSVGSFNTPKEFFQELEKHGIRVIEFNPVNPLESKKTGRSITAIIGKY